MIIASVF